MTGVLAGRRTVSVSVSLSGLAGIPTGKGHRPDLGLNRLVPKRLSAKEEDAISRILLFR